MRAEETVAERDDTTPRLFRVTDKTGWHGVLYSLWNVNRQEAEMEYILTGREMAEADRRTSEVIGIPSIVLMERAALAVTSEITRRVQNSARVCILAGPGNNGADGLAVGRLLMDAGYPVQILLLSDRKPAEGSSPWTQRKILESYPECYAGTPVLFSAAKMEEFAPDVIVDALFGTGLGRPVTGKAEKIILAVNEYRARRENCLVVGLDMPSGVSSDDGSILGCAPQCDLTVTFAFYKRGHLLFPGAKFCGQVILKQIGITGRTFAGTELRPAMYRLNAEDVRQRIGVRDESGNKGTFGKVLLIAGSRGMCGAALMGAEACMRSGAGMVRLFTREENRVIVQERLPEAMLTTYGSSLGAARENENTENRLIPGNSGRKQNDLGELSDKLLSDLKWADVAAIGPGIGQSAEAVELVRILLEAVQTDEYVRGIVLDADALRILSGREDLRMLLAGRSPEVSCILTPHLAEFADLLHIPVKEAAADRESRIHALAEELHCTVTGKDARTMIGSRNAGTCLITNGNSGMATAGSGDVLTGITAAVLTQVSDSQTAAETAAWIHAQAGDAARQYRGEHSMIAGDLIQSLPQVMRGLEGEK